MMQERRKQCWADCFALLEQQGAQGVIGHYLTSMINTMKDGRTRDTHAIMLGRPLDHHVRSWDRQHGLSSATTVNIFRRYAGKLLAITMMSVIGLWICRGAERQRLQQSENIIQQALLFDDEGVQGELPEYQGRDYQTESWIELSPRNRPVAEGGWGTAISHLAVGVEWAPDPP